MISVRKLAPALFAVWLLTGCGRGLATLTGDVTYDGQPVGDGTIKLTPADGKGPIQGGTITQGKYTVSDVPPGPKIVLIEAYRRVSFASSSEEMMQKAKEAKTRGDDTGLVDPADVIPPQADGNQSQIEIKSGMNQRDFHLKKPAGKRR